MKNIVILGSTGSIGTQAIDIVRRLPEQFRIVGLAANANAALLAEQATSLGVRHVCIGEGDGRLEALRHGLAGHEARIFSGVDGMSELATLPEVDLVVMAVAGA